MLAVSTTASTILQANLLRVEHHRLVFVFPLIRTLVLFTTQLHIHTVRVHKFTAVRMGEWNSFHITKWDSRSKLDSEAISGWNKALETPLCAIRADQTYLLASETKRSCKSLRVNRCFTFSHGTAYGNLSFSWRLFRDLPTLLCHLQRGTSRWASQRARSGVLGALFHPEIAS